MALWHNALCVRTSSQATTPRAARNEEKMAAAYAGLFFKNVSYFVVEFLNIAIGRLLAFHAME